jgi:Domain of unknown function (DUF4386)
MSMTAAEIAEERRRNRLAGAAAIAAGVLFAIGSIWSQTVTADIPENDTPAELRFFDRHAGELIASSALRSVAVLLLAVATVQLYRATRQRKPDLNPVVLVLGIFGPFALAIGGLVHDIYFADAAADFTSREVQNEEVADDLSKGPVRTLGISLIAAGTVGLAFWFVTGSLNAMRVGLLTRFIGVLGIIIGPALLIISPTPMVMAFWLIAVGVLFLGFWPRGIPPAWPAGEAVPWPSATAQRASSEAEPPGGSRDGEVEPVGPGVRKPDDGGVDAAQSRARRKRKRRR